MSGDTREFDATVKSDGDGASPLSPADAASTGASSASASQAGDETSRGENLASESSQTDELSRAGESVGDQPLASAGEPVTDEPAAHEPAAQEEVEEEEVEDEEPEDEEVEDVEPLELIQEPGPDEELSTDWYILKVQVNREDSIRDALQRRVKIEGLDRFFKEIIVPTEDVAEFSKTGKRRVVKRKLYPGYIMVNMHINDETWFLVRETPGIGDFTGSAGKPTPMNPRDVERILNLGKATEEGDTHVKTAIPFKRSDRVRVKEGYFQNFEGDVETVDEANGRVTVMINIFGRSTPVELEHWQIEAV